MWIFLLLSLNAASVGGFLFSLLLGFGYAFLLYKSTARFSPFIRSCLFVLRMVAVATVCFLLFAPFIQLVDRIVEKPLLIFIHDNSASIKVSEPKGFNLASYTHNYKELVRGLEQKYQVKSFTVGEGVKPGVNLHFNEKISDLNASFRYISDHYINRNIGAVIFATDGIYNRGGSPQYSALAIKAPIYPVPLGDTLPKKDLLIANIRYNSVVYSDNNFQVAVNIDAYQSKGRPATLVISDSKGKAVFEKTFQINSNEFHSEMTAVLRAGKKGFYRYRLNVLPLAGELSTQNNKEDFLVEVIEGKQHLLILANSPHPDISAMKQCLEENKNYEVKTELISAFSERDLAEADLLILHQLPSFSEPASEVIKKIRNKPVWFVLGAQTNIKTFSNSQHVLELLDGRTDQEVTAALNDGFYTFSTDSTWKRVLQMVGPVRVPFGSYRLKAPSSVLLYQQIGKVISSRPLWLFSNSSEYKVAILGGEGLWRWRLNEFRETGKHDAVDGLISKTVQYLTTKEDKRKFRVTPSRFSFDESDPVLLNAELYNDANELVNTPDATVVIKGRGAPYSFTFSRTGNAYSLDAGTLPSGEYSFVASAKLGGRVYQAEGRFMVTSTQLEFKQTIANHQLLYSLARESGGEIISPAGLKDLPSLLNKNELVKTVSYEDRRFEEIISIKWIFFIIVTLLTAEWIVRKQNGDL